MSTDKNFTLYHLNFISETKEVTVQSRTLHCAANYGLYKPRKKT